MRHKIANDLNIPLPLIDQALLNARTQVKRFTIKKKNGTDRVIFQPSKRLKVIQYWLIHNIFNLLPVHSSAMAYQPSISILDNATRHKHNRYFVKLDIKDFFPSIQFSDLLPYVENWHKQGNLEWELDDDAKDIIDKACFYKNSRLAVGYPSSPSICNAVMYDIDQEICSLLSDIEKFGEVTYTRYADDLVISTNKKGVSKEVISGVTKLIEDYASPKLKINHTKTKIGSSTGGSANVTGLKICPNEHITIHRKNKDHVRLLLSLYSKGSLKKEEFDHLLGHLSFIQHVAPDFYSKLNFKYFKEIESLKAHALLEPVSFATAEAA